MKTLNEKTAGSDAVEAIRAKDSVAQDVDKISQAEIAAPQEELEEKVLQILPSVLGALASAKAEIRNELLALNTKQSEELKAFLMEYMGGIKEEGRSITTNLDLILKKYKQEMVESTHIISKSRFRNLLLMLATCICFTMFSSWFVNRYFPRFVEIGKSGNVLIKDSKILLSNDNYSKNIPKNESIEIFGGSALQKVQKPTNQNKKD